MYVLSFKVILYYTYNIYYKIHENSGVERFFKLRSGRQNVYTVRLIVLAWFTTSIYPISC